ncbi:MAG: acetate kinase [Clostridia bacterium]|nr:acetate kinase [Clostridia bacterium]
MKVLVINAGSSSLKYQLIDNETQEVLVKGLCERIGIDGKITHKVPGREPYKAEFAMPTHNEAIGLVLKLLTDDEKGVISSIDEIGAVGHRIAHGGEKYNKSTVIDDEMIQYLEGIVPINPLHGPPAIAGIKACMAQMPQVKHVGVFDTSFYANIEPFRYIYPIPYKYYEEKKIRKYGFHGTSHRYVTNRIAEVLGKDLKDLKIVTCHLGNGSSVTATKNGVAIDTSMGFTPQDGVVMGTRSGAVDPSVLTYIMKTDNISAEEMDNIINKQSGFLGISEISSDARNVEEEALAGNERAILTQRIVGNSVKKLIGAYIAEMNGIDVLIFTAGVGENDFTIREYSCDDMENLGIAIDKELNKNAPRGQEVELTAKGAKVRTFIIPTNEEVMIARDAADLAK